MKYSKMAGGLVLALTLLVSMAFAGNKSASMVLTNPVQVNGKQLPAGTYQLKWDGAGPAVEVQFLQSKKLVATAPARLEQTSGKPYQSAAVIDNSGGAGSSLMEARFAGKNYKLVFAGQEAQAQNARGGGSAASTNK